MPEQRSVLKEYRDLDEKRLTQGLSPDEQARFVRLRELVGAAGGAPGVKPGFDVNAAAAALRESLLPAGLRHRPPPTPVPPPADEGPAAAELADADALASAYEEAPPAAVDDGAGAAPPDGLFDPASLGGEQPPYDPSAQPFDPNAPYPAEAGYDASAPAWDPNQPWDPNVAQEAYPADPNAAYPADPNAAYSADPNATYPAEAAYDAGGQPAWDPEQPWDPNAAQEAYPADPNATYPAEAAYDAGGQPAWDPGQPWDPNAVPEAQLADPGAAYPADQGAPPEGGSFTPGDAGAPAGWDAEPPPLEPVPGAGFGEYDAEGGTPPFADGVLLGEAPPPGPEYLEAEAAPAAPQLGEYDDTAGFAAEPFEVASVPEDALALESALPPPELEPSWQPDAALDAGFQAESGGSFGAGADAAAPEWARAPAAPPWEGALADLGAPPEPAAAEGSEGYELAPAEEPAAASGEAIAAPDLDFSHPDFTGSEEAAAEPAHDAAPDGVFDAELPELPPEEPGAAPPPLELSLEAAPGPGAPEPVLAAPELAGAVLPEPVPAAPELDLPEPETEPLSVADLPPIPEIAGVAGVAEAPPLARPGPAEAAPGLEPDLSFDVAEEAPAAPAPGPAAPAQAAPLEELSDDIPTIDGADILEEIIEDVPSPPPQSLDFEPLGPAPSPQAVALPPLEPAAPSPEPAPFAPPPVSVAPAAIAPVPVPPPPPVATAPAPSPAPAVAFPVPGSHRVVVHTVEGLVRRGVLEEPDLAAPALALAPQAGAPAEDVPTDKVKAIFFMLAPGEKPPAAEGRRVRVTFRDGRQIAGFSPDYREDGIGFFMIPADTKTNTGRIWVFRAAVRQVSVS